MILSIPFSGGSLAAAASRTMVLVQAGTGRVVRLKGLKLGADGNNSADKNLSVEVIRAASDGTGTSVTVRCAEGPVTVTPVTTAKENYTVEPGTVTVIDRQKCAPSGGINDPLMDGRELVSAVGGLIGIRISNPAGNSACTPEGTLLVDAE